METPARPYSALIIGGLWPSHVSESWAQTGAAMRNKACDLLTDAEGVRYTGDGVLADRQSGRAVSGFVHACYRRAHLASEHADEYFAAASAAAEIAWLLDGLCHDLDDIDDQANRQIHQILTSGGDGISAAAKTAAVNAIAAEARAQATEKTTATAAAISTHTTNITG